jgi:CHRD domain
VLAKAKAAAPTLASAALIAATATADAIPTEKTFLVPLSGEAELNALPAPVLAGDEDASGQVRLSVDLERKLICYDFTVSGVSTPLMAHIHKGTALDIGPSVVTLFTGPGSDLDDCRTWTVKWLSEIVANPSSFYVNFYTTEFPDGALRGQLLG